MSVVGKNIHKNRLVELDYNVGGTSPLSECIDDPRNLGLADATTKTSGRVGAPRQIPPAATGTVAIRYDFVSACEDGRFALRQLFGLRPEQKGRQKNQTNDEDGSTNCVDGDTSHGK